MSMAIFAEIEYMSVTKLRIFAPFIYPIATNLDTLILHLHECKRCHILRLDICLIRTC